MEWLLVLGGPHDARVSGNVRLGSASVLIVDISVGDLLSFGLITILIGRFHVKILIKAAIILNRRFLVLFENRG